jgi:hypothetical protein
MPLAWLEALFFRFFFPFFLDFTLYTSQKASVYPDWIPLLLQCVNCGLLQTCENENLYLQMVGVCCFA